MEHASENGLINHESLLRKITCKKNREKVNYKEMKRAVVQINVDTGAYINEYESIAEAVRKIGVCNSTIQSVASHDGYHKTAGGFGWIYADEYDPTADNRVVINQTTKAKKRVAKVSQDGEILAEYNSIKEASIQNNFPICNYIGDVCNGKKSTYKGFKWIFI